MKPAQKPAYIALDTAYAHGAVVLFAEGAVIYQKELATRHAHGQMLALSLKEAQDYAHSQSFLLSGIFCGLGPGSFVGVRLALASALGYSFAKSIPLMGFCSHQAIALSVASGQERLSIVMKASGEFFYVSNYALTDGMMKPVAETLVRTLREVSLSGLCLTDQPELVQTLHPDAIIEQVLGPSTQGVYQAARAAKKHDIHDQSAFIKPNYIKPPSVSPINFSNKI